MRRAPIAASLVLAACVKTINPEPVPVPGVVMQTWSVEVREPRARDIFMRNDTDGELVVTGVQLYNCRNIKQECKAYPTNVVLAPGKTVKAMRIEPENLKLSWHYNYNYQLRGVVRSVSMPTEVVTRNVAGIGMGERLGSAAEFRAAVSPISDNPTCSPLNPQRGPDGSAGWVVVFGVPEANMRTVTVYTGPGNTPVQYSDMRHRADGQRTVINVLHEPRIAIMRNTASTGPDQVYNVASPDVMTAASLGNPDAITAYVLKECGPK